MRVLIVGSRQITEFDLSKIVPKEAGLIISGGAKGIDKLAEKYADDNRISKLILQPQYKKFGKSAPLKRNEQMVEIADKVIVIWDGYSKGSFYTFCYAERMKKDVLLIRYAKEADI